MKNGGNIFAVVGNALTYVLATIQANEVFQIIELVFSILTSVVIITLKIISWFKKASKDGEIDSGEVDELIDIISKEEKEEEKNKK